MEEVLPSLDFSDYGLSISDSKAKVLRDRKDDVIQKLAKNMLEAIQKKRAVLLKNSGADIEQIRSAMDAVGTFYDAPVEDKKRYTYDLTNMHGWGGAYTEQFGSAPKTDLCEAYGTIGDPRRDGIDWPSDIAPELETHIKKLVAPLNELGMRTLDILSIALGLEDTEYLREIHNTGPDYFCVYRFNVYRALRQGDELKPGEMRIGDHTDGGTFTLVFPENGSGLQILLDDGTWQDVPYTSGMVLLFVGDTLEYITCGRIKQVTHRVKVPDGPERYQRRYSLAFLLYAHKDTIIGPIDGSVNEKYPPVKSHKISLAGYYSRYRPDSEYAI